MTLTEFHGSTLFTLKPSPLSINHKISNIIMLDIQYLIFNIPNIFNIVKLIMLDIQYSIFNIANIFNIAKLIIIN